MKRLARKDVTGKRIRIGDIVRIIGVPDLSGMSLECRAESLPVLEHTSESKSSMNLARPGLGSKSEMALMLVTIQWELNRTY